MKIVLIGAPGSGKSWLAEQLAPVLGLDHIEADALFWENGEEVSPDRFRERVRTRVTKGRWIFEGHIGKIGDIVIPQAEKIIVVETSSRAALYRSTKRDLLNLLRGNGPVKHAKKILHNLRHRKRMEERRVSAVAQLRRTRPEDVLTWSGRESIVLLLEKLSKPL